MLQLGDEDALGFDLLPRFGDIFDETDRTQRFAIVVEVPAARPNPTHAAVGTQDAKLVDVVLGFSVGIFDDGLRDGTIVGMDARCPSVVARLDFANLVAEDAIEFVVPDVSAGPRIAIPRRQMGGFDGKAQPLFALAQRLLSLDAPDEVGRPSPIKFQPLQLGITWPMRRAEMG